MSFVKRLTPVRPIGPAFFVIGQRWLRPDRVVQERSSIGRAPVSKTGGCEFDSRRSC